MFLCHEPTGNTENPECLLPAEWYGTWSDRIGFVCDKHRDNLRWDHARDHAYDKTGITWHSSRGEYEYESVPRLAMWELTQLAQQDGQYGNENSK